jgi:SRSO17 transposase
MTRVRLATLTVTCIDEYCAHYRSVFHNVRYFELFTQLILGMLAETKRKSLPRLANAEWFLDELRAIRLRLTRDAVAGRPLTLCIDETGDPKKGRTTDYAVSQYLGSLHHVEPGIVSVNAYGCWRTSLFRWRVPSISPKPVSSREMYFAPSRNWPSTSFSSCSPWACTSTWC